MQSNICNVSIFINSFTSNPNNRVRIQDENHKKQINTCLIKEDNGIYWYIYKFYAIIFIKINSSSLQVLCLYKRGELLMNQRKPLKELNLQKLKKRIRIIFRKEVDCTRESSTVNCCRRELLISIY